MDPAELHGWLCEYNWDDGVSPVWSVADDPRTEFATALLMYWRLEGPWLEADTSAEHAEHRRLQAAVRERLLKGFYSAGASAYDPRTELSRVQVIKFRRAGVPELLLTGRRAE